MQPLTQTNSFSPEEFRYSHSDDDELDPSELRKLSIPKDDNSDDDEKEDSEDDESEGSHSSFSADH